MRRRFEPRGRVHLSVRERYLILTLVRSLRQIALLVLAVLLSGGPGLVALGQTLCAPQRIMCPMCVRPSAGMDCMGAERNTVHSTVHRPELRQVETVAVQASPAMRCFCGSQGTLPTVDAVSAPGGDGKVLLPASTTKRTWWPDAPAMRFALSRSTSTVAGTARFCAPLPLRV